MRDPAPSRVAEVGAARPQSRPQTPLQLPIGTLDDLVEVRAENKIVSPDVDKTYETRSTLYFAPHIGLVKVESENPTLDRVLIEYRPGSR